MQNNLYFYDQAPNRPFRKRYRKYNSVLVPVLSGVKSSPTSPTIVCVDQAPNFSDGPVRSNLLPELTQTYISLRNRIDSSLTNIEEIQRQLYEQTKNSSGKILEELAIYLETIPNLAELIPKSLEYQLMCGYKEFIENIVVIPRQWQTTIMREQARLNRISKKAEVSNSNATLSPTAVSNSSDTGSTNCEWNQLDPALKTKKRQTLPDYVELISKVSTANTYITGLGSKYRAHTTSERTAHIRFSLTSSICWRKGYAVVNDDGNVEKQRNILQRCYEILHNVTENMNLPKLSPTRIYYEDDHSTIKTSMEAKGKTASKVPVKPVFPKNSKHPSLSNVPVPNIPMMEFSGDAGKILLQTVIDEGASTVLYPPPTVSYRSGNIAVVRFRRKYENQGFCTLAFEDVPTNRLVLNFLPNGYGWFLHKNGNLRLFVKTGDVYVFNENSTEIEHYTKHSTLAKCTYQVSSQIYLHCSSQAKFSLHVKLDTTKHFKFNLTASLRESVEGVSPLKPVVINKSAVKTPPPPPQRHRITMKESVLMTTGSFLTRYAKDLLKAHDMQEKQPTTAQKPIGRKSLEMSPQPGLELSEESQLKQLQKKARCLVNSWMEHYQVTIGFKPKISKKPSPSHHQQRIKLRQTYPGVHTGTEPETQTSISITVTECDSKQKQNLPFLQDNLSNKRTLPPIRCKRGDCENLSVDTLSVHSDVTGMKRDKENLIRALQDVSR